MNDDSAASVQVQSPLWIRSSIVKEKKILDYKHNVHHEITHWTVEENTTDPVLVATVTPGREWHYIGSNVVAVSLLLSHLVNKSVAFIEIGTD